MAQEKLLIFRVLRKLNTQQNGVLQLQCSRAKALIQYAGIKQQAYNTLSED